MMKNKYVVGDKRPQYPVTAETHRVHLPTCRHAKVGSPLTWPRWSNPRRDKACKICLPNGLPDIEDVS